VYVLWGGEGLWRQQAGAAQVSSASTSLPEFCSPSSAFIRHASSFSVDSSSSSDSSSSDSRSRSSGSISDKYMPSKSNQCSKAFIKDVRRGKGESEVCEWLSPEKDIQSVLESDECLFNALVCVDSRLLRDVLLHLTEQRDKKGALTSSSSSSVRASSSSGHLWTNKGRVTDTSSCSAFFLKQPSCRDFIDLFALKSFRVAINHSSWQRI
jgi:hypothetical protein